MKTRIHKNVDVAIEKLKAAESELMKEVEAEFDKNPFERLLRKSIQKILPQTQR